MSFSHNREEWEIKGLPPSRALIIIISLCKVKLKLECWNEYFFQLFGFEVHNTDLRKFRPVFSLTVFTLEPPKSKLTNLQFLFEIS